MRRHYPSDGQQRTVRKFAWFPIFLPEHNARIWLEYYYELQVWVTLRRQPGFWYLLRTFQEKEGEHGDS